MFLPLCGHGQTLALEAASAAPWERQRVAVDNSSTLRRHAVRVNGIRSGWLRREPCVNISVTLIKIVAPVTGDIYGQPKNARAAPSASHSFADLKLWRLRGRNDDASGETEAGVVFLSLLKSSRNKWQSQDVDHLCLLAHLIFSKHLKHRRQEREELGGCCWNGLPWSWCPPAFSSHLHTSAVLFPLVRSPSILAPTTHTNILSIFLIFIHSFVYSFIWLLWDL